MLRRHRDRKARRIFLSSALFATLLAGLAMADLIGCGGGSVDKPVSQTPIGSTAVAVSATSGTESQTVTLMLQVQ
jgi:hypothetical protein